MGTVRKINDSRVKGSDVKAAYLCRKFVRVASAHHSARADGGEREHGRAGEASAGGGA